MRFNFRIFAEGSAAANPVFRWLATGSSLNSAGMQGEQVVVGLLVYQFTGSSAWVGISLALFFAPMLLIGVPAGALADRYDKRKVLIATELALTLLLLLFGLLLITGTVTLFSALAMSLCSGSLRALHHPARLSLAGDVAGSGGVVSAMGLLSVVSRAGQLSGALGAGVVAEVSGPGTAYLLLAFGHLLALRCFFKMNIICRVQPAHQAAGVVNAIREYLHMLATGGTVILLVVFASMVEVFGFSFATAMPEIAVESLSLDAAGLGVMHGARATGGLLGALLLSALMFHRPGMLYLFVVAGFGMALFALGAAPSIATVLLAIAIVAAFASAADILIQGMLQLVVPAHLRGRAMGAWVVALGMGPLGHLELGFLIASVGTAIALGINGGILIATSIAAFCFFRSITGIRDAATGA